MKPKPEWGREMKILPEFVKNTVIGGIIFLLPLGIAVFAIGELLDILSGVADKIAALLFPGAESTFLSSAISVALLVAVAFSAGLIASTGVGGNVSTKLQNFATGSIPGYAFIRQTVSEMSSVSEQVDDTEKLRIAKIDFGPFKRLGVVVDQISDEECVVYLPSAPSAFTGQVAIVRADQIKDIALKPSELMSAMRRLGRGLDRTNLG